MVHDNQFLNAEGALTMENNATVRLQHSRRVCPGADAEHRALFPLISSATQLLRMRGRHVTLQ